MKSLSNHHHNLALPHVEVGKKRHPNIPSPHMSHPNTPNLTCILIVQRDFVQGLYRGEIHQHGLPEAQLHLLWVLLAVQELHEAVGRGEEQGTIHLVKPKPRKPLGARWRSTKNMGKTWEKHGKCARIMGKSISK